MEKGDDEFDKVYGDSVFSITDDAQFPIFDAQQAKEGIITNSKSDLRRRKNNPENNYDQKSQFPQIKSSTNLFNKSQIPIPESNDIKIDEPLQLSREISDTVPIFARLDSLSPLHAPTLMNRISSFGRGRMIGPSTAKPLPVKNIPLSKPAPYAIESTPLTSANPAGTPK